MVRKIILFAILSILILVIMNIPAALAQVNEVWTYESINPLYSVDVTSGGDMILTGGGGSQFILLDSNTGVQKSIMQVTGTVQSLAIADKSGDIAIATTNKQLFLFDSKGNRKWNLGLNEFIEAADISPDGKLIVVGTTDGYVKLINSSKGEVFSKRIDTISILSVAINNAGDRIAAGSSTVYMLDGSGNKLWSKAASRDLNGIEIAQDTVAAASAAGIVHLYDMGGNELSSYKIPSPISSLSISESGRYIAIGSSNTNLYLLEGRNKPTLVFERKLKKEVEAVGLTGDGTRLVAAAGKTIYYFDTGVEPDRIKAAEPEPAPEVMESVTGEEPVEEIPAEEKGTPGFTALLAISGLVLAALRRK